MKKFRLRTICPYCDNNKLIDWTHYCSSLEYIDINGNIECQNKCRIGIGHILDMRNRCCNHEGILL